MEEKTMARMYQFKKHEPMDDPDMVYDVVVDVLVVTTFPDDVIEALVTSSTETLEDGGEDKTITMSFFDYEGAKAYFDKLSDGRLAEADGYSVDVDEVLTHFSCWFVTIYEHRMDVDLRHCIHSDQALERSFAVEESVVEMLGLDKWLRDI